MPSGRPCLDRPLSAGVLADGSVVIREIQLTLIWLCYIHQWQTASSSLSPGLTSFGWLPFFCLHVDFLFSCAKNIYMLVFFFCFKACVVLLSVAQPRAGPDTGNHTTTEKCISLLFIWRTLARSDLCLFFFSGSKQNGLTRFTFGWMLWHSGGRVYICACQELLHARSTCEVTASSKFN